MSSIPKSSKSIPPVGLLAEAGFEEGDFFPLYTFNPLAVRNVSFTATTWSSNLDLSWMYVVWDELFPPEVFDRIQVFALMDIDMGGGETVDIRLRNVADGETIAEQTGITTNAAYTLGPVDYVPSTTSSEIEIRLQWREDPGVNSSRVLAPFTVFGVRL